MKLGRLFNLSLVTMLITACIPSQVIAANNENYAATISFTNSTTAKDMVYSAYMSLGKIGGEILKLHNNAAESANDIYNSTERYPVDLKFQMHKLNLNKVLLQGTLWLKAFNEDEIFININDNGFGHAVSFDLPKMTIKELGIAGDDLISLEHAKTAIKHVMNAIDKINSILPQGLDRNSLEKFIKLNNSHEDDANILQVASQDDSHELLVSLFKLNYAYTQLLNKMLSDANDAAKDTTTEQERMNLDTKFQSRMMEIACLLDGQSFIGHIKIFNNNDLSFTLEDKTYHYTFTQLNLDTLNLTTDNVLDKNAALKAIEHTSSYMDWARDWVVAHNTPYKS